MPKELNYCIVQRGRKPSWEIKHLAQVFYLGKTPAELSQEMFSTPSGLVSALYPNLRRRGPDDHLWDLVNFFFQGEEEAQARPLQRKGFPGMSAIGLPGMGGVKEKKPPCPGI